MVMTSCQNYIFKHNITVTVVTVSSINTVLFVIMRVYL